MTGSHFRSVTVGGLQKRRRLSRGEDQRDDLRRFREDSLPDPVRDQAAVADLRQGRANAGPDPVPHPVNIVRAVALDEWRDGHGGRVVA